MIRRDTPEDDAIGAKVAYTCQHDRGTGLRSNEREHCLHEVRLMLYARNKPRLAAKRSNAIEERGRAATMKKNQRHPFELCEINDSRFWRHMFRHSGQERLFVESPCLEQSSLFIRERTSEADVQFAASKCLNLLNRSQF